MGVVAGQLSRLCEPFFVPGVPMPKGSGSRKLVPGKCPCCHSRIDVRSGVGRLGPYTESADAKTKTGVNRLKKWSMTIRGCALVNVERKAEKQEAVEIVMMFFFERPKSVKRAYPTVKPDTDKLARAVLDALTGIMYVDDSQVVDPVPRARYALPGESPGVRIWARTLGHAQLEFEESWLEEVV